MNYGQIPSSWGHVIATAFKMAVAVAVFTFAINMLFHLVPMHRGESLCWLARDYWWPIHGWTERLSCVAIVP